MDFCRWNNRNNSEISEISEIIALLFHLCASLHYYCYSGVGPRALLQLAHIIALLLAFSLHYSAAKMLYHYTLLWHTWFCCDNANNREIKQNNWVQPNKMVHHYTLLCTIIHYYCTIIYYYHSYCNYCNYLTIMIAWGIDYQRLMWEFLSKTNIRDPSFHK